MSLLLAVLVGIPLFWHFAAVAGTYYDAGRVGMNQRKWAAVTLFVPLFGFFAYLFERSERSSDNGDDPYAEGAYNFHDTEAETETENGPDARAARAIQADQRETAEQPERTDRSDGTPGRDEADQP